MTEIFISYASEDEDLASFIHSHLQTERIQTFLAKVSLEPGERWGPKVLLALKRSKYVVFLASHSACRSAFVQQELGVAIAVNKQVIPIVWNIGPEELPGWTAGYQCIDLRGKTQAENQLALAAITRKVRDDRAKDLLVLGGLVTAGLLIFGKK